MTYTPPHDLAQGTCPVCNGSGRAPAGEGPYRHLEYGYHAEDNTRSCQNCGGQKMYGVPTGKVLLRPDGTPCTHEYKRLAYDSRTCYEMYKCVHCGDIYDIDSGD